MTDPPRLEVIRGGLTEPTPEERYRFQLWLIVSYDTLGRRWYIAEALSRAYDRAAVVTSSDGDPTIPPSLKSEIDELTVRWECLR